MQATRQKGAKNLRPYYINIKFLSQIENLRSQVKEKLLPIGIACEKHFNSHRFLNCLQGLKMNPFLIP